MSTNFSCNGQWTGTNLDSLHQVFRGRPDEEAVHQGMITTYRVFVRRFAKLVQERGISPEQLTVKLATVLTSDKRVRGQHGSGHVESKLRRANSRVTRAGD